MFDITVFVANALASKPELYKDIDRIYKRQKYRFYRSAKENNLYNHPLLTSGSLLREEYAKKVLGILCVYPTLLLPLLKKGWKKVFALIQNKPVINLEDILTKAIPDIEKVTDDEINNTMIAAIALIQLLNKDLVQNNFYYKFSEVFEQRLRHAEGWKRLNWETLESKYKIKAETIKADLYQHKYIRPNLYSFTRDEELAKISEAIGFIFDLERMDTSILEEIQYNDKDISELASAYFLTHWNLNKNDAARFVVSGMYIKGLLKAYRRVKEQYFANNRETLFIELEELEQQNAKLLEKVAQLEIENQRLSRENNELRKQAESGYKQAAGEYQAQIREIIGELVKLKTENELDKIELAKLRELFFSLNVENVSDNIKDACVNLEQLRNLRAVVVGGHERWQQRLRNLLPEWKYIGAEQVNFPLNLLDKVDVVFFYAGYVNHAVYYRMINEIRRRKIRIEYLQKNNESQVLREIASKLNKT